MPLTIHSKRPVGWGEAVSIHYLECGTRGCTDHLAGVPMTAEGNDWFAFT